jgi:ankyrin repeat protein
MLAVSQGRLEMVSQLIESGADINIQDDEGRN